MDELEVTNEAEATFYLANEVLHEYHGFPLIQRADIGNDHTLWIQLNGIWFQVVLTKAIGRRLIQRLEGLYENAQQEGD